MGKRMDESRNRAMRNMEERQASVLPEIPAPDMASFKVERNCGTCANYPCAAFLQQEAIMQSLDAGSGRVDGVFEWRDLSKRPMACGGVDWKQRFLSAFQLRQMARRKMREKPPSALEEFIKIERKL